MKRICTFSTVAAFAALFAFATVHAAQAQNPQPTQGAQPQPQQTQPGTPAARDQLAPGQPERQPGATEADRRFSFNAGAAGAAMQTRHRTPDQDLAACLIVDNEGEVFASQLAQRQSQNAEVKQFAEAMVSEHSEMIKELQHFAGQTAAANQGAQANVGVGASNNEANATNTAPAPAAGGQPQADPQGNAAPQAGAPAWQPLDFVALKREVGELCKQTLEREFSEKSGAEFDKCYMGQQIGAHLKAIDHMKAARNHASPELQKLLDEGIVTAEDHLMHAKELAKKLEGPTTASTGSGQNR